MKKKSKGKLKEYPSIVVGFGRCANCGWTENKFNWHVHFVCPECGCTEYEKWRDPFELEK